MQVGTLSCVSAIFMRRASLEELLALQPGPHSEKCAPDLSWLGLQSCLAKLDLDQLTPS